MGNVTMTKCDGCGKIVEDRYVENGWIQFDTSVSISRSAGRKPDRTANTDFMPSVSDFCSLACMEEAFDRIRASGDHPSE